jgi:hypothetical protein
MYTMSFSLLLENNDISSISQLSNEPYFLNIKRDNTNNLTLLKHCYKSDKTNEIVQQCDGIIVDNNDEVVCYSGKYIDTINTEEFVSENYSEQFDNLEFTESIDGTFIRLYFHNDVWMTATKGHTDARKASWNSDKNFSEMFWEIINENYPDFSVDTLEKNKTYAFLMQHKDNRTVCPTNENKVYFINTFHNETFVVEDDLPSFQKLPTLSFSSYEDLEHKLLNSDDNGFRGVYIRNRESGKEVFVLSFRYEQRQKLLGNTLNIEKRYLKLRQSGEHNDLLREFPEFTDMANNLEQNIYENVGFIHNLYMEKFVRKTDPTLTKENWKYLYPIHGFYMRTRNIVTREVVECMMSCINEYFGLERME